MTRVVEHLANLIRIPSVSALSNRPVIEYAEQVLHAAGWQTLRHSYSDHAQMEKINLIAAPPGQSRTTPTPAQPSSAIPTLFRMPHRGKAPSSRKRKKASCMAAAPAMSKVFLACLLASAESADAQDFGSVRIVLTADEEIGCVGAKHLLAADILHPLRLVIGEPTSLHPARAGKGYCLGRVTITGQEAHSAHRSAARLPSMPPPACSSHWENLR